MSKNKGRLYIRKLTIVDDMENTIYECKDKPVKTGFAEALKVIEDKDSKRTLRKILMTAFIKLDQDFIDLFYMEVKDEKKKN